MCEQHTHLMECCAIEQYTETHIHMQVHTVSASTVCTHVELCASSMYGKVDSRRQLN